MGTSFFCDIHPEVAQAMVFQVVNDVSEYNEGSKYMVLLFRVEERFTTKKLLNATGNDYMHCLIGISDERRN